MILGVVASSISKVADWMNDSLISYYNLNADSVDSVGTNHGAVNSVTFDAGKMDNAMHIADTTNSGAAVPSTSDFTFGDGVDDQPFSISMYVYFDTLSSTTSGWLAARRADTSTNLEWQISIYQGDLAFVLFSELADTNHIYRLYDVGANLSATTWYHMIFTYDGSSTKEGINIYIDNGSTLGSLTQVGPTYTAMDASTADMTIGYSGHSSIWSLDGKIDGMAIWNIELSSEQRTEIYNTQSGGDELVVAEDYPQDNAASIIVEVNDTTGWSVNAATLSSDATEHTDGSWSLKGVGSSQSYSRIYLPITLVVGKIYEIKIWAKRGSTGTDQEFTGWTGFNDFQTQIITSTTWTEYKWRIGVNTTACEIRVYCPQTDIVYADKISIKEDVSGNLYPQDNAASVTTEVDSVGYWLPTDATIISTSADKTDGSYSLEIEATSASSSARADIILNLIDGNSYTIKIWAKRAVGSSGSARFYAWTGFVTSPDQLVADTWTEYTFNVEANAASQIVRAYAASTGVSGDTILIDKITIVEV